MQPADTESYDQTRTAAAQRLQRRGQVDALVRLSVVTARGELVSG